MEVQDKPKITTPYINLQSDYGFKRLFGTEEFRGALLQFLSAVLGDDIKITDVEFHDKEILPESEEGKKIVYDVYCTMTVPSGDSSLKRRHLKRMDKDKGVPHHFILEMQNIYEPPFEDRMLYYTSKIVSSQGYSGWNYDLDPVVLMAVTDFDFSFLTPSLMQDFRISERTTGEVLTDKFRMLFFSLRQVPDEWEDCKNEIQRLLYLIKNMDKLDKTSKPYLEGGYEKIFEAAESNRLVAEDVVLYSQSLDRIRAYQAGIDYAAEQSMEKGIEIGREQEKVNTAKILIMMNQEDEFISQATGLTIEKIRSIRNTLD